MAYDGAYLCKIKEEISILIGAKIEKISQPVKDTLVLTLRGHGQSRRLLLSAAASAAKIHFTTSIIENPPAPPMFCMLLRKYLGGGKLLRIQQPGLDRVLFLTFECANNLGDRVELSLCCEIMGRHSNIILLDSNNRIIDAIKRVDFVTSEARQVLPGMTYLPPPRQNKLSPLNTFPEDLAKAICHGRDIPLAQGILEKIEGLSPMLCREISYLTAPLNEPTTANLNTQQQELLIFYLGIIQAALAPGGGQPWLIRDSSGKVFDFTFIKPQQFPNDYQLEQKESFSALVDSFFAHRNTAQRIQRKGANLYKLLINRRERLRRKLLAQQQELILASNRERKKELGDIISANLYALQKGDTVLQAIDFFNPQEELIKIPLDPTLSPSKNAQKYYSEYRKAAIAEDKLKQLLKQGEEELHYLETILAQLKLAETEADLAWIREEAIDQGYIRTHSNKRNQPSKHSNFSPLRYLSSDGFIILCGRNNLQNDQLTLREAHNYDLWLHTQKIPGSHTVILSKPGQEFPRRTIQEAAIIAAYNSSARESAKVPVDYTLVRNVKKPRGARPGMVTYHSYQTAIVNPDSTLASRLLQK